MPRRRRRIHRVRGDGEVGVLIHDVNLSTDNIIRQHHKALGALALRAVSRIGWHVPFGCGGAVPFGGSVRALVGLTVVLGLVRVRGSCAFRVWSGGSPQGVSSVRL